MSLNVYIAHLMHPRKCKYYPTGGAITFTFLHTLHYFWDKSEICRLRPNIPFVQSPQFYHWKCLRRNPVKSNFHKGGLDIKQASSNRCKTIRVITGIVEINVTARKMFPVFLSNTKSYVVIITLCCLSPCTKPRNTLLIFLLDPLSWHSIFSYSIKPVFSQYDAEKTPRN